MKDKDYVPDHTAHIQRTGYPLGGMECADNELPICARCGQEIGWQEKAYHLEDGWVCEDCLAEDLDDMGLESLAMSLGIDTAFAWQLGLEVLYG